MMEKRENGLMCCGKFLSSEDGVNGSIYFECDKCGRTFNLLIGEPEDLKEL
jgi:hypothetical protein